MPDVSMFPTDNLYKFLALSGVALVILATYVRVKTLDRLDRQTNKLLLAVARTQAAVEWLKELSDAVTSTKMEAQLLGLFIDRKESALLRNKEDEARVTALRDTIADQKDRIRDVKRLAWLGVLVSVVGFAGWYFQLQRPQDTLLHMQVQAAIDSAHARHAK